MIKAVIGMGFLLACGVCMQCIAYICKPKKKEDMAPSPEYLSEYAGKHVMTNGYGGPVIASGDTLGEAQEKAYALYADDPEARSRLVSIYVSSEGRAVFPPLHLG